MLKTEVIEFLKTREFVSVATADFNGNPNAAPKFLLKIEGDFIYLVDYIIGRTWENIKINPKASLSFMDPDKLLGYQINGMVEIIKKGKVYDQILNELSKKKLDFSAKRIIEGVYRGKRHESFEISLPERFVVFKVKLEEIVEIGPCGELKREKL